MHFLDFDSRVLQGIRLEQSQERARVNHATVLLAWFCVPPSGSSQGTELGSGSAVVSIYLARRFSVRVTAIEIDSDLCKIAQRNVKENCADDKVSILELDIAEVADKLPAGSCDFVVSNPPHYLHEGKRSKYPLRNLWRRADASTVRSFLSASEWLLKNRGAFFFALHPRDLVRWMKAFANTKLGVHRMRFVHGGGNTQAQLVLLSGRKGSESEVVVEPPIVLKRGKGIC